MAGGMGRRNNTTITTSGEEEKEMIINKMSINQTGTRQSDGWTAHTHLMMRGRHMVGGGEERGSCKSQLAGFPWLQLVPAVSAQLPVLGLTGDYYSGAGHT